jgi:hypothetical protein
MLNASRLVIKIFRRAFLLAFSLFDSKQHRNIIINWATEIGLEYILPADAHLHASPPESLRVLELTRLLPPQCRAVFFVDFAVCLRGSPR